MEAYLIINGVDFTPYIAAGGFQQGSVVRRSKSVVTGDGTLHKWEIVKRRVSVKLLDGLRIDKLLELREALRKVSSVRYTDLERGERTADFHIEPPSGEFARVQGGNTFIDGYAFSMEEV